MPTWVVSLLPLLGVVVGAATQHLLSRTQEAERQRRTLRKAFARLLEQRGIKGDKNEQGAAVRIGIKLRASVAEPTAEVDEEIDEADVEEMLAEMTRNELLEAV